MMNINAVDTMRASPYKWFDLLDEGSLPEVKLIMQQYAARDMNRRYREEQQQK